MTAGTFVPAKLLPVRQSLSKQADLETAHHFIRQANKRGGKQYRITSEMPVSWHCAYCQMTVEAGDTCACGHRGNA